MKKFIFFLTTVFLSLFLINNKVFAQTEPIRQLPEYPIFIFKARHWGYYTPITENANTYEFEVEYYINDVLINTIEDNDYFLINDIGISFRKGLDRRTNSYEMIQVFPNTETNTTWFTLQVTVLKSILNDYYPDPLDYYLFFLNDTALYIYFPDADTVDSYNRGYTDGYNSGYSIGYEDGLQRGYNDGLNDGLNIGYDNGYNEGFNNGWQTGYNAGYRTGYNEAYDEGYNDGILIGEQTGYENGFNDGYEFGYDLGYDEGVQATQQEAYQRGYDDGYEEATNTAISRFTSNLHVWIVPAIIVVVVAGIFIGYRRERHWND